MNGASPLRVETANMETTRAATIVPPLSTVTTGNEQQRGTTPWCCQAYAVYSVQACATRASGCQGLLMRRATDEFTVERGILMRFYALIAVVLFIGASVLIGIFGASARTFVEIGLLVLLVAPEIVRRTPRLYLAWHRLLFTMRNTPATWDVHVQFRQASAMDLPTVVEGLLRWSGRDAAIMASEGGRYVLKILRRFVLELHRGSPGVGTAVNYAGGQIDVSVARSPSVTERREPCLRINSCLFWNISAISSVHRQSSTALGWSSQGTTRSSAYTSTS